MNRGYLTVVLIGLLGVIGCASNNQSDPVPPLNPRPEAKLNPQDLKETEALPASGASYVYTNRLHAGSADVAIAIVFQAEPPLKPGPVSSFKVYCSEEVAGAIQQAGKIVEVDPQTGLPSKWHFKFVKQSSASESLYIECDSETKDVLSAVQPVKDAPGIVERTALSGVKGMWTKKVPPATRP